MSRQQNQAFEELFVAGDRLENSQFEESAVLFAALSYVESALSSDVALPRGSQDYYRVINAYCGLLNAVDNHLGKIANIKDATGYHNALFALRENLLQPDLQPRTPWLAQLTCIRHLAETSFSVLPDRLVHFENEFHRLPVREVDGPSRYVTGASMNVIRLGRNDMANDEERAAFDRLVAIDVRNHRLCRPRLIQYLLPNPESIEAFHEQMELEIEELLEVFRPDGLIVRSLRRDDDDYAETVYMMRLKATELARERRDDLPIAELTS